MTEPGKRPQIAVLVSGSGTLLEAMLKEDVPIRLIIADRECRGVEIAKQYHDEHDLDMEFVVIDRRDYGYGRDQNWDRRNFSAAVADCLDTFDIDVAAMAGFMTILDRVIFTQFDGWVLNIHPSLLPKYKGEHAVRDALAAGVSVTGTTIHVATDKLDDESHIIAQMEVPINAGDDEARLHERIKVVERELYTSTLFDILNGSIDLNKIYPLERS